MYVNKSVREIAHLHVLTDDNTISCLNEVKDQKTGAWQHHREEMGTATNNGTYNILKNITESCVTIARQTAFSKRFDERRFMTHVHSYCSACQAFCLVAFSLPTWFI